LVWRETGSNPTQQKKNQKSGENGEKRKVNASEKLEFGERSVCCLTSWMMTLKILREADIEIKKSAQTVKRLSRRRSKRLWEGYFGGVGCEDSLGGGAHAEFQEHP
jgi:hypothetical protein